MSKDIDLFHSFEEMEEYKEEQHRIWFENATDEDKAKALERHEALAREIKEIRENGKFTKYKDGKPVE